MPKIEPPIRVRLVRCDDPWTKLEPGAFGTATFRDDAGTLHVRWDSGSSLGLVAGQDEWEEFPVDEATGEVAQEPSL
jgi:hypothetical protein